MTIKGEDPNNPDVLFARGGLEDALPPVNPKHGTPELSGLHLLAQSIFETTLVEYVPFATRNTDAGLPFFVVTVK